MPQYLERRFGIDRAGAGVFVGVDLTVFRPAARGGERWRQALEIPAGVSVLLSRAISSPTGERTAARSLPEIVRARPGASW